jgi:hypothetical protein
MARDQGKPEDDGGGQEVIFGDDEGEVIVAHERDPEPIQPRPNEVIFDDKDGEIILDPAGEKVIEDILKTPPDELPLPNSPEGNPQIVPGEPGDEFLPPVPGHPFDPPDLDHDNPENEGGDHFRIINEDGEDVEVNAGDAPGGAGGGGGGVGGRVGEPGVEEEVV